MNKKLKVIPALFLTVILAFFSILAYAYYGVNLNLNKNFEINFGTVTVIMPSEFEEYTEVLSTGGESDGVKDFLVTFDLNDEQSSNHIKNFRLNLKYSGKAEAALRAELLFFWAQDDGDGNYSFPRMNSTEIFDYNQTDFKRSDETDNFGTVIYFYAVQDSGNWIYKKAHTAIGPLQIITNVSDTGKSLINTVAPENYTLSVMISIRAVQYTRALEAWGTPV